MANSDPKTAAIVLAAGASTRMGRPKQLLEIEGQALIVRTVNACLDAGLWPVVVVLGANFELIKPALARLPVVCVVNAGWAEGMASSLRTGIAALGQFSRTVPAALICLCDQPGFNAQAAQKLESALGAETEKGIAAARYDGRLGAPVIFRRKYFAELSALTGDQGARVLLKSRAEEVVAVDLPELAVDIDTPEDYAKANGGARCP